MSAMRPTPALSWPGWTRPSLSTGLPRLVAWEAVRTADERHEADSQTDQDAGPETRR